MAFNLNATPGKPCESENVDDCQSLIPSAMETSPSTSSNLIDHVPAKNQQSYLNSSYTSSKLVADRCFVDSISNNAPTPPGTITMSPNQQSHSTGSVTKITTKFEKSPSNDRIGLGPSSSSSISGTEPFICAGCNRKIVDRYLLSAVDKLWHEDCLKCDACGCRLAEVSTSFFVKCGKIYCRRDYARLFGAKGTCSACNRIIPAFELVMRANSNVYHLECFGCQECNLRFCVGDTFYLDTDNNKILCEYDYHERLYFAQLPHFGYNSLAQLKRQISQVDDYDDIQTMQR